MNDCFKSTYINQLENIEDTITDFEQTRDRSSNQNTKDKYQKAIDKLEEIKELFIKRYKNILEYEELELLEDDNNVPLLNNNNPPKIIE